MTPEVLREVRVETITSLPEWELLRDDWARLWERCPSATPLQAAEWLIPWWKQFHPGELWTLAVWNGGTLVAMAPLFESTERTRRSKLLPVGTGNTDCWDVLIDPAMTNVGRQAIVDHLAQNVVRWDLCEFHQLPKTSPLLPAPRLNGRAPETTFQDSCPVLRFPQGARAIEDCIPANQLKRLRYSLRRLTAAGTLRFEGADKQNLERHTETLFDLHTRRWSACGRSGVLNDAAVRNFHRMAAAEMLGQERLRLSVLSLSGRPIAAFYGFHGHQRTYYYLGGFDPDFQRLSPGMAMVGLAIEQAVAEGAEEFNFLRGREPYKYDWGARDRFHLLLRYRSDSGAPA